ncbi:sensor histidine kinase [Nocardia spumae]|uniref:sensor histidine kinase n=1 Tax=Nocardia spumae TaxID=2887190 RepID=UPI001D134602|nr:sensor histidine kinase [Nocardia spumae]
MRLRGPALDRPITGVLDRIARRTVGNQVPSRSGIQQRRFAFGAMLAMLWLLYLIGPIVSQWHDGRYPRAVAAAVCLLLFWVLMASCFGPFRQPDWDERQLFDRPATDRRATVASMLPVSCEWPRWVVVGALATLSVALVALLGLAALATAIYVAAAAVFTLPPAKSGVVVAGIAVLLVGSTLMPGLHFGSTPLYFAFVPVIMWTGREIGARRQQLRELVRRQQGELAIVEERNRVARDVHDILGHSLTVITVKTELAQRLLESDPARAGQEMADVERLAREALAGVRDTVGGLREVTLHGEIANARTALRAAGIDADLPDPADLPDRKAEIFGWVLREAVTNVVRHSGARHCRVRVEGARIEIRDDGAGSAGAVFGSGLTGLGERVRAAGGVLTVDSPPDGGVLIAAEFPE